MTDIERYDGAHSLANGAAEVQIEHHNALRLLGALPPNTFTAMVDEMALGRQRLLQVMQKLMVLGVHYGTIPGTPKPTLYKPGAELLCQLFGLIAEPEVEETLGDGETGPDIHVQVICRLRRAGSSSIAAVGVGSANNWEVRHRYGKGDKVCPQCKATGSLMRSKYDPQPWVCLPAKGGCNAKFPGHDKAIISQFGRVERSDPYDARNTLLKMAKKRALVDAIIAATAASDLWTQDHEDDVKAQAQAFEVKRAPAESAQKPSQAAAPKAPPAGAPDDAPPPPDEAPPPGNGEKSARQQLADCYTGAAKTAGVRPTPNGLVALAIRVLREQGEDLPDGAKLASLTDAQCEIVRKHIQRVGVE